MTPCKHTQSRYSGLLLAKVEKAVGNKRVIDLTEMQTGSKLHSVCINVVIIYQIFFTDHLIELYIYRRIIHSIQSPVRIKLLDGMWLAFKVHY